MQTNSKTTHSINKVQSKSISSNILCKDGKESINCMTPVWPSRVDCKQINSIQKPPHLRSKVRYDIIIK